MDESPVQVNVGPANVLVVLLAKFTLMYLIHSREFYGFFATFASQS